MIFKGNGVRAFLALGVVLALAACGGKDEGLLLPMLNQSSTSTAGEVEGGTAGATSNNNVGGYDVSLPSGGSVNTGSTPSGDFSGITFTSSSPEFSGFISIIVNGTNTSAEQVGSALVGVLSGSSSIAGATVVASQQASGASDTQLLNLQVNTNAPMTANELSNLILTLFGTSVQGGTVSALPVVEGQSTSSSFRVVVQITYSASSPALVGVGVSTEANYGSAEPVLGGLLDGTNFGPSGATVSTVTNLFTGASAPKADFLFVVDNSGSMAQEQTAVANVASAFFDRMSLTGTDFKIGVITTDSASLRSPGFTSVKTEFQSAVNAGTSGSGKESGLHFAIKTLSSGGATLAAGYPRSGSSLSVVILSDEGDQYACYNGGSTQSGADPCNGGTDLNTSSNLFTQNGLRVYSIIGLNATTGQPGTCSGNGTSANASNNAWPAYNEVSQASGGASSSICSNDFSAFLNIIANQGVGAASAYQLTKVPISSSIVVMVNGSQVAKSSTNGYVYDSVSNSLIFSGSAIPAVGAAISVTYNLFDSNQSGLGASLIGAARGGRRILIVSALVAAIALGAIALLRRRRENENSNNPNNSNNAN